jgi:hypothetical protein
MFKLSKEVYLDTFTKCYKNIVVLSKLPENNEEIKKHVKTIPRSKLSPFKTFDCCSEEPHCVHAFIKKDSGEFITIEKIDDIISILYLLGYMIDYDLTKIMLKNKTDKHLLFYVIKRP